jgi:aspartyl-tRNA synthetase
MSFVDEEDVFRLAERMFEKLFKEIKGVELQIPFPRLTYEEAMDRFGTDKPDLRYGMEIVDVTDIGKETEFKIFRETTGKIRMIQIEGGGVFTRKEIETLESLAQESGAKGLLWMKEEEGKLSGPLSKYFPDPLFKKLTSRITTNDSGVGRITNQGTPDSGESPVSSLYLFIADDPKIAGVALGKIRLEIAKRLDIVPKDSYKFCWITHYPLFEWNEEDKKWTASHHIFSMPRETELLEKDPGKVTGKVYDIVCNGEELASGSIRIHLRELQERVMKVIGISPEDANRKFGYLLEAFQYGAPPHGGIAPGIDRIVALLSGSSTIRDVIPFPKTSTAQALLEGAPSEVDEKQLKELNIKINRK